MSRLPGALSCATPCLIVVGSAIFAVGVDCFEIPYGLAAGGVTGLATVFSAIAQTMGVTLPVGLQTIVINALLMALVVRSGDKGYIMRTVAGIIACGVLTDALVPVLPVLGARTTSCCAPSGAASSRAWGSASCSARGQHRRDRHRRPGDLRQDGMPVGVSVIIVDGIIIAFSATVFSIEQALYAAVAMFICGKVIDAVVDGPALRPRGLHHLREARGDCQRDPHTLNRGCTELQARGVWSGKERPSFFCVLGRSEAMRLKQIVAACDPEAIVIISEVHEAFGEGFHQITG